MYWPNSGRGYLPPANGEALVEIVRLAIMIRNLNRWLGNSGALTRGPGMVVTDPESLMTANQQTSIT